MKVVELYPSNYRDIPATLRVIADQLENGEISDVAKCAIVMFTCKGEIETFGLGEIQGPESAFLFQMGINKLVEIARLIAYENNGQ